MDRKIVRQAVIDLGGCVSARQVAEKLNISYELSMHHLSSLKKSGDIEVDKSQKVKGWYVGDKPERKDLRTVLLALVKDKPGIAASEVHWFTGIQASNVRDLVLPLESSGQIFVERSNGPNKLYLMEDKPVVESKPTLSVIQAGANSLNIPVEKYEELLDKDLGQAIHDAEFKDFLNVFYQGSGKNPLHMGGR